MRRVLSLYLPMWPIDRVRRRRHMRVRADPTIPAVLLVRAVAGRELVVMGCERAISAGVSPGMTLAHARALVSGRPLCIERSDPEEDRSALHALAVWATCLMPAVAPDPDDDQAPDRALPGLLADVTGCERLYRGEVNLLRSVLAAVGRLGFRARVASASTAGAAWALARFASDACAMVEAEALPAALSDLPIRGLRIDPETEAALVDMGVTTIGQVLGLPRRGLPSRFGPALIRRIDQLLGRVAETVAPVRPSRPLSVTRLFDGPVARPEVIESTACRLLDQLCQRLLHRESGARRLRLTLDRSDCEPYQIGLSVSRCSREARHLWALLRPKLERAHLGYGVEAVTLSAGRIERLPHRQHECLASGRSSDPAMMERELAHSFDTLANRLGKGAVCRLDPMESYLPERVVRLVPAEQDVGLKDAPLTRTDRPSVLLPFPRPLGVMAMTPDGPVVQMTWRGERLRVLTSIGPERITPEWWRGALMTGSARDYFKVQDERGRWWWLYREQDSRRWFLHGGWT